MNKIPGVGEVPAIISLSEKLDIPDDFTEEDIKDLILDKAGNILLANSKISFISKGKMELDTSAK